VASRKPKRARAASSAEPAERSARDWLRLLALLPGYDCYRDANGFRFDAPAADMACDFFAECLRHIEGEKAGSPFTLEPWQQALIGCLFGWKRADGYRRYREAFIYIPRKNGKTPLAAGIANFVLFCDAERGQQNIVAAADSDQASLLFRHAAGMVESEPELATRADVYRGYGQRSIVRKDDPSAFRVVSSDARTKHGGNLHLGIVDELHAQPDRELVDVIRTSMASANRRQPLFVCITTADIERMSICNESYDYACKVRDGIIKDSAYLPVVYEAKPEDDWTSEATWAKANPNLGVSVSVEYLRRECAKAREIPAYENTFKRLHLNIRTQQDVRWIPLERWDACDSVVADADLLHRTCFAGLDLGSTRDLTALVLAFPVDERIVWKPYFWVPEETMHERVRRDRVPYDVWVRLGLMKTTPGNTTDYDFIRRDINEIANQYAIQEMAVDRLFQGAQLSTQLQADGFNIITFGMGYASMTAPTKELERLIFGKQLVHNANPVLRWMAANVAVSTDAAGNIKPDKAKATERIDGIVAGIMALGRLNATGDSGSVYSDRGILVI
jgi:phage terminase large subunit-like protein